MARGIAFDMSGKTVGMLTVLRRELSPPTKVGALWLCRCACGQEKVISRKALRKGQFSCGCVALGKRTHFMSYSPTYRAWTEMKRRCFNPSRQGFKDYGARGISVCERWLSFENFLADMGEVQPGFSIERVDNNAGYSPENCIWIPKAEQSKNRRSVKWVTIDGERIMLRDAVQRAGLNYTTVKYRIDAGWPTHKLFDPTYSHRS